MDNKLPINQDLLFVGGDLSGIQKFLYNITSKKAAVSLKGRSQYLDDIIKNVQKRIESIPEVSNSFSQQVYSSGGKFYLIVKDTPQIREAIDDEKNKIKSELWEEHRGQLSINIGYVPFSFNEDDTINVSGKEHAKLGHLWHEVNSQFATLKTQKFKHVIDNNYNQFFSPIEVGGQSHICAITGIESSECVKLEKESDEEELYVLPSVKKQIDIGKQLRAKQGFKTFEEYAKDTYLGVLRMDVDGLGKVFIEGFPTFQEYTAFSHTLSEFFEKKLTALQASAEYSEYLNIIYAGGDDMFVVGRWDKVINFAYGVRNAFIQHVNKKNVSISGGIAIVDPKFPISKAAELSGDAETAAKEFHNNEKNAFNFFGQSVSWNKEFEYINNFKQEMVDLCEKEQMPRSILHKLITLNDLKSRGELKYIWNTAYYLSRFRAGKKESIKQFCDKLEKELLKSEQQSNRNYELLALSARWAELQLRQNNNNKKL